MLMQVPANYQKEEHTSEDTIPSAEKFRQKSKLAEAAAEAKNKKGVIKC